MKRPPSASCDASCAASSGPVPSLGDIPAGKIRLASRTWRRIVSTESSSFFSMTVFPPTLNPLPQWRERARSLPVPRGNTATAGTRRHLCSAIKFRTQPTEPCVKEEKGRENGYVAATHEDPQVLAVEIVAKCITGIAILHVNHLHRMKNAAETRKQLTAVKTAGTAVDKNDDGDDPRGNRQFPNYQKSPRFRYQERRSGVFSRSR